MLVTAGEEASWPTQLWAPKARIGDTSVPRAPGDGHHEEHLQLPNRQPWATPSRSPLELIMHESLREGSSGLSLLHSAGEFSPTLNWYQLPTLRSQPQVNSAFQLSCLAQSKPRYEQGGTTGTEITHLSRRYSCRQRSDRHSLKLERCTQTGHQLPTRLLLLFLKHFGISKRNVSTSTV